MSKESNLAVNEDQSIQIDDLTIENNGDRFSIYGSANIQFDKKGLFWAKELQGLLEKMVNQLEGMELPDELPFKDDSDVENPFN